jgi:hypothetical protein
MKVRCVADLADIGMDRKISKTLQAVEIPTFGAA